MLMDNVNKISKIDTSLNLKNIPKMLINKKTMLLSDLFHCKTDNKHGSFYLLSIKLYF